jgi:hypothetical protein
MRILSFLIAGFVRLLNGSLRVRHVHVERIEQTPQYILSFWHAHLFTMLHSKYRDPITVMSSRSKDGELAVRVYRWYGVDAVRGSSTRGGNEALREFIRRARKGSNLVFTPDGPKGPARLAKPGVVFAAQMTGLPILPMAFAAKKKSCSGRGIAWSSRCHSRKRSTSTATRSSCRATAMSRSGAHASNRR